MAESTLPIDEFDQARQLCDDLTPADEAMTRELFSRLADKWSVWVMDVLVAAGHPLRFSRLMEQVGEISQKSLTKTLRQLERDGLVTRTMFLEVPPRVEYAVTPLGLELLRQVHPVWLWVAAKIPDFRAARQTFDRKAAPRPPA